MKFKTFLMIVICTGMALPSTGVSRKINGKGEYVPYYGHTIIAKIDTKLEEIAKQVENFIQRSSFRRRYSPLSYTTYHMTIYTIYSYGNQLIPPVKRWLNEAGAKIPNSTWLPDEVLGYQNNRAMCILENYLKEPLHIKYASLKIDKTIISLTLEVEEESLRRIQNARKELVKVYEHPNRSMEPIHKKLHITLAYAYGKKANVDIDEWNELNELVRSFNGAKLIPPSVYRFGSMQQYYKFEKQSHIDCRAY